MDDALDFGCRRRQKLRYFEAGRRSTLRHSELLYTTRAVILVGIVQCSEKQTDSIFKLKSQQYGNIWAWCRKCLNSAGTIEFRRLFLDTGLITANGKFVSGASPVFILSLVSWLCDAVPTVMDRAAVEYRELYHGLTWSSYLYSAVQPWLVQQCLLSHVCSIVKAVEVSHSWINVFVIRTVKTNNRRMAGKGKF